MPITDCSSNEHLISKVYFPRLLVPTAAVVVAFGHPIDIVIDWKLASHHPTSALWQHVCDREPALAG
jgi:hypothetical protein